MTAWVTVVSAVLAALALFAAGLVVVRSSWIKAELEAAETRIAGLRGEVTDLARRESTALDKADALETRVLAVERENEVLRSVIGARDELAAMRSEMTERLDAIVQLLERAA